MKGYKVFKPDWTCNGFQYKVGETYTMNESPILCQRGFHFCENLADCFSYYAFDPQNKAAEVEVIGEVVAAGETDSKHATNKIRILREVTWEEVLRLVNTGHHNSGCHNTGDSNSGNHNAGHHNIGDSNSGCHNTGDSNCGHHNSGCHNIGDSNSGHHNSGCHNTGYFNSGNHNTGHHNSGDHNSGCHNTGYYNSGHYNTGNHNSGNHNTGFLNTNTPPLRVFNKETDVKREDVVFPNFFYFGIKAGQTYKEAFIESWEKAPAEDKRKVFDLPNWDADLFLEISGIDLRGKQASD